LCVQILVDTQSESQVIEAAVALQLPFQRVLIGSRHRTNARGLGSINGLPQLYQILITVFQEKS
jgi:hypothetical protein